MDSPFVGQIQLFAFNYAPYQWAFCDGSVISVSQNQVLFALISNIYGGDGNSTFALPDLRGRVAVGQGTGNGLTPRIIGQNGGTENVTLTSAQTPAPAINATLKVSSGNATQSQATAGATIATPGTSSGRSFTGTLGYNTATPDTALNTGSIQIAGSGGNPAAHPNMQPFLVLNYCIALTGIFPSRN